MSCRETTERQRVAEFLLQNRVSNAYPLGYVDESYASYARWFCCEERGEIVSLITVYTGLSRPGLFTSGRDDGIELLVNELRDELPERVTGHVKTEHLDSVLSLYRPSSPLHAMSRMSLARDRYADCQEDLQSEHRVVRLTHIDTAAIMRLYAHWPDNFFEPFQLESGLYFGVKLDGGELVSIAGIHNLSETYDVAAIGNLVTHPQHRGEGFARLCTARLLRETFQRVALVTLDVQQGNAPAIRTYQHFGFEHDSEFYEGELVR